MSTFTIQTNKIKAISTQLTSFATDLANWNSSVNALKDNINLGASTLNIRVTLTEICSMLNQCGIDCRDLGSSLTEIVQFYIDAENSILENGSIHSDSIVVKTDSASNNTSETSDKTIFEQIQERFQLSDFEFDIIKLVLAFIPGVNCIVDIFEIINDIQDAAADGHLSWGEFATIGLDVISLVSDTASLGALIKSMEAVADGTKVAKTGGIIDKAKNFAKKADDVSQTMKNASIYQHADNTVNNAKNAVTHSDIYQKASHTANSVKNNVKNSTTYRKVQTTASNVKKKASDKVGDYVYKNSNKSTVTLNDARKSGEKFVDEVAKNIQNGPKDFAKNKLEGKIREEVKQDLDSLEENVK